MALQKIDVPISFGQGPDTKTDPKQVGLGISSSGQPIVTGRLLYLQNARYKTLNSFIKRNGYDALSLNILGGSSISNGVGLASFQNQLNLFDGNNFYSFSESISKWSNKGPLTTANFSTYPVIKNTSNQSSQDSTFHSSGLSLYAWEDSSGGVRYSIVDTVTGQQIIDNQPVSSTGSTPRVCTLGTHFVIFYVDSSQIQYKSISISTPNLISSPTAITSDLNSTYQMFDVAVVNSRAFVSYTNSSPSIGFYYLTTSLVLSSQYTVGSDFATCISAYGDSSNNVWVSYYNGTAVETLIVNNNLNSTVLSPTVVETVADIVNIAGITISSTGTVFYEVSASAGDNIRINTITSGGTAGTPSVLIRSLGLASKAFVYNSNIYIVGTYPSTLQGKYFLLNSSGQVISRFSGEPNLGGGLITTALLPSVNQLSTDIFQFSYLQVDQINFTVSVTNLITTENATVQTGVMQGEILFNTDTIYNSVLSGNNLNLTGALPVIYDGNNLVEQGFNVYPENITLITHYAGGSLQPLQYEYSPTYEWIDNQGQTHRSAPSAPTIINLNPISGVANFQVICNGSNGNTYMTTTTPFDIPVGSLISGSNIAASTYIIGVGGNIAEGGAGVYYLSQSLTGDLTNQEVIVSPQFNLTATTTYASPVITTGYFYYLQMSAIVPSTSSNIIYVNNSSVLQVGMSLDPTSGHFPTTGAGPNFTYYTITAINGNAVTLSANPAATGNQVIIIAGFILQATAGTSPGQATFSGPTPAGIFPGNYLIQVNGGVSSPASGTISSVGVGTIDISGGTLRDGAQDLWIGVPLSQNLQVGMIINDNNGGTVIPVNAVIEEIDGNNITLSDAALQSISGEGFTITTILGVAVIVSSLRVSNKQDVNVVTYRTQGNGTVFSRSHITPNDPSSDIVYVLDITSDSQLANNPELYTTGGVVQDIALPPTNLTTVYNNRQIAVPIENSTSFWYSQQIVPGFPVEFSDSFINNVDARGGAITAIAPQMDDKLIWFKENNIFYIVAQGPSPNGLNNDFNAGTAIISSVGCSNQKSIVQMPAGLMFQASSNNGIWLLTRDLGVNYIGADVEAYNSYNVTSAQLIPSATEVRFTLSNGTILVYDYYVNKWDVDTNLSAVDSCLFQNEFTFLNSNGTVYQEAPGTYTDNGNFIPLGLTTSWLSFAGLQGYQRVYEFLILGQWYSAHNLQVQLAYNFNSSVVQTDTLNAQTSINPYQFRVFLENQKCESVQITLTEQQSSSFGQGLSLSGFNFIVGKKQGHYKMPAAASYG